jgi:hypothetical protein
MRVVMVMYVRDEEDVLEANLRAHLALGVDFFVIVDHRSTDRTPQILRRYEQAGFAEVTRDESEAFQHKESEWGTELARRAATEHGADWVLHADADEFWWPLADDLKAALAEVPDSYAALLAPRVEYVARPDGPGPFVERLTARERFSRVHPKIAHRGHPEVQVPSGAHSVTVPGAQGPPHVGRASLRAADDRFAGSNRWTPTAPVWTTRVLHFPVRSFEHFRQRVELALFATGRKAERERTREMLDAHRQDRLEEIYGRVALSDEQVAARIAAGELVEDRRLGELLARSPDPVADPEALSGFQPVPPGTNHAEDLAELAQDAMQAMWRAEALAELRADRERERAAGLRRRAERRSERLQQQRRRTERLRKRRRRLERRLRTMRRTRWWRLGQRLRRVPGLGRLLRG